MITITAPRRPFRTFKVDIWVESACNRQNCLIAIFNTVINWLNYWSNWSYQNSSFPKVLSPYQVLIRTRLSGSLSFVFSLFRFSLRDNELVSFSLANAKLARLKMKNTFIFNCKTDFVQAWNPSHFIQSPCWTSLK